MPCQIEVDRTTRKITLHFKLGGQYTTTKTVNGNTVYLDSGGELVRVEVPNGLTGTINLAGLPFKAGSTDHADALRVLDFHGHKGAG